MGDGLEAAAVASRPSIDDRDRAGQRTGLRLTEMPPDYARTEFGPVAVHRLSDDLAMVSGSGVWKNTANDDMTPFGMTYTLRRTEQTWRIVVAAIHVPDGGVGR